MDSPLKRQDPPILQLVEPGETVHVVTEAADAHLLLTDRRLAVALGERIALDVPLPSLRRIQFDIEKRRPAALVFVPESVEHQPQVLTVSAEQYQEVGSTLAVIGLRLEQVSG